MVNKRLFERLGDTGGNGLRSRPSYNEVLASIVEHLTRLLNTRRGSAPIAEDYGLPDFNDLAKQFPDAIYILRSEIRRCIEKYEPRLRDVRVEYVKDVDTPLSLKYDITARFTFDEVLRSINIETSIDPSGYVEIRG